MSSRNKKKRSRKPKANAVQSKRRARRPSPTRPQDAPSASIGAPHATPGSVTAPGEQPREGSRAPLQPPAEDAGATWWADVWPFVVETGDEPTEGRSLEPVRGSVESAPDEDETSSDAAFAPFIVPRLPEPTPPAPARSGRSRPHGWQVAVLVAAVAVVGILGWRSFDPGSDESAHLTHADTYEAPVPLRPDTSFVRSRILPSGDIDVTHWIRSRQLLLSVSLTTPEVPGLAPRAVRVSDVFVAGDGTPLPGAAPDGSARSTTIVLLPTHRLYLRYRLSGAVEASGGPHNRALARITSLDVSTTSRLTSTTRTVVGAKVLALACSPIGSREAPTPCGTVDDGRWTVDLVAEQQESRVMAQLNLS